MSFLSTVREYARKRNADRRRLSAYLYLSELPSDLRKDIGWSNAADETFPTRH